MSIEMFISEMHVQVFAHVNGSDESVPEAKFMENFMSDCELNSIQIREDEKESDEVEGALEGKFESAEVRHHLEEQDPIENHGQVKAPFEIYIISFKLSSLTFIRVDKIKSKYLVEKRKEDIND